MDVSTNGRATSIRAIRGKMPGELPTSALTDMLKRLVNEPGPDMLKRYRAFKTGRLRLLRHYAEANPVLPPQKWCLHYEMCLSAVAYSAEKTLVVFFGESARLDACLKQQRHIFNIAVELIKVGAVDTSRSELEELTGLSASVILSRFPGGMPAIWLGAYEILLEDFKEKHLL